MPLNDRYLMAPMALLCVAAAGPPALLAARGASTAWRVAGAACLLVLLVGAVDQGPRYIERRDSVVDRDTRRTAARDALKPAIPCFPLVVPNHRLKEVAATWLDVDRDQVLDGRLGTPPGSYLWGTEAAMKNILVVEGRQGDVAPPPTAPVVRRVDGWTLMARCP
jgi:hypothetical protein